MLTFLLMIRIHPEENSASIKKERLTARILRQRKNEHWNIWIGCWLNVMPIRLRHQKAAALGLYHIPSRPTILAEK